MNVSHKLEKHICRRKLRQSYNSFPSNFKGSSSFGSFILLTLLEFILVGREQADGGQGISRFVTEDVIVLDVTKLRNVFTGINPIISPAFGLQFESLFFVQVLHGDLVRVLLLGLTHAFSGERIKRKKEREKEKNHSAIQNQIRSNH
mmetsp:Transcript_21617/g.51077  ORF Transcript_21617/g.51077 Transcript_21617/m.51077 type:complete len:147 (-) Transcript_21617:29-469(-)